MKNLLLDIGNSDIKSGIIKSGNANLISKGRFSYSKKYFKKDFEKGFKDLHEDYKVDKIGISILNDKYKNLLVKFFKNKFNLLPVFIDRDLELPIKIKYSGGLGIDRICSASAAVKIYNKKNILVIDFGTASTFTLISDNVLTGGLISPGIMTSLNSLLERTSLPSVKLNFPENLFSDNTIENIKGGVLFQSLFSAERIIREAKKIHKDLFIIGTGGYSGLISSESDLFDVIEQDLVLKGINFIISK